MFIMSKDGMTVVNAENMASVYIGLETKTVRADMVGGSRYKLGEYDSLEQAKIALDIVSRAMHTGSNLCKFPSDSDVKAHVGHIEKNKSVTGKKVKSHGGS